MSLLQCEEVLLGCGPLDETPANATFSNLFVVDHHITVIHPEVGARLLLDGAGQLTHVREGTLLERGRLFSIVACRGILEVRPRCCIRVSSGHTDVHCAQNCFRDILITLVSLFPPI